MLTLLLVCTGFAMLIFACEKEDVANPDPESIEKECEDMSALEQNFVTYDYMSKRNTNLLPDNNPLNTEEREKVDFKITQVIKENCEDDFINNVASYVGFPIWDRSDIWKQSVSGRDIIFTGLARPNADTLSGIIIGLEEEKGYQLTLIWKKALLEELASGSTPEYENQLRQIENLSYSLFGTGTPPGDSLGGQFIESRCGWVEVTTCEAQVLKDDDLPKPKSGPCADGLNAVTRMVFIGCGSGGGDVGGDLGGFDPGSIDGPGGFTGSGGSSGGGSGSGDGNGPGEYYDDNGDPIDDPLESCYWQTDILTLTPAGSIFTDDRICTFTGVTRAIGVKCKISAYIEPPIGSCADYELDSDNSDAEYAGAENIDASYRGTYISFVEGEVGGVLVTIGTRIGRRKRLSADETYIISPDADCYYPCVG